MIYTVTFNPAIDYVVRLDAPLEVGEVNRAKGEDCVLGGKGINVSGVLAELGCRNTALGFVAGETGAWLERGLAAQGLKTDFVHLEQGMTRINVKIKAGQETELNGAGPDIPESAMQELEKKLDSLNEDDILILAGSIPASLSQDTYERLLARLQGRGVRAVVDATRDLLVNVLQPAGVHRVPRQRLCRRFQPRDLPGLRRPRLRDPSAAHPLWCDADPAALLPLWRQGQAGQESLQGLPWQRQGGC